MRNSRKEGILIVKCKNEFQLALEGQLVKRKVIVCNDINKKAEYIAYDLEQMLNVALMNIANKNTQHDAVSEGEQDDSFYKKNSPSVTEVEDQAQSLQMMISMNSEVKMSKFMQAFEGLVSGGLVKVEGDIKVTPVIWDSIHRDDKIKIMCNYIAFFVNPLQKLLSMSTTQKLIPNSVREEATEN